MLFGIVEGSGSIARSSMLMYSHSGEIAPTIMEAPGRVQLCMVKDPGVKLLGRWVRDEMVVPSLPQLRGVVSEIHQVPALSSLMVEVGGKGVMHGGLSSPSPPLATILHYFLLLTLPV